MVKKATGVVMTVCDVKTSGTARIAAIDGAHDERIRLMSMGLRRGLDIKVMRNNGNGPIVVAYGTSRMALGREMAGKIRVE